MKSKCKEREKKREITSFMLGVCLTGKESLSRDNLLEGRQKGRVWKQSEKGCLLYYNTTCSFHVIHSFK